MTAVAPLPSRRNLLRARRNGAAPPALRLALPSKGMEQQTLDFLESSSRPVRRSLRTLLGQHTAYFGVDRRAEEPANLWQSELSSSSIDRIMNVTRRVPRDKWPTEVQPWLQ